MHSPLSVSSLFDSRQAPQWLSRLLAGCPGAGLTAMAVQSGGGGALVAARQAGVGVGPRSGGARQRRQCARHRLVLAHPQGGHAGAAPLLISCQAFPPGVLARECRVECKGL